MQFHERLYEIRKRSGMTQNDLAEKLGVSRQAVSRWEMGTAKPEFENLIAISDLFGVSIDYLLKGMEQDKQTEDVPQARETRTEADTFSIWDKLLLWGIVLFTFLMLLFGMAAQDIMTGIVSAAFLMAIFAAVVGAVSLIAWIVREILRRVK